MSNLNSLTASVHRAMKKAEAAVMPLFQRLQDSDVREKEAGEKVTAADERSEAILSEELARLLPHAMVVGEEAAAADPTVLARLSSSSCWIIDPLDGTNNFASGKGPFGIMVALCEGGHAVGGWILDPISGRFCHATKGSGAWVDGYRVSSKPLSDHRQRAALSSLFGTEADRAILSRRLEDRYEFVPMPRCAAAQYPAIALGETDVALFGRTLPWDHAAGVVFINECGGRAARLDGSEYLVQDSRPNMIVAACPRRWDQFANAFNGGATLDPAIEPAAAASAALRYGN